MHYFREPAGHRRVFEAIISLFFSSLLQTCPFCWECVQRGRRLCGNEPSPRTIWTEPPWGATGESVDRVTGGERRERTVTSAESPQRAGVEPTLRDILGGSLLKAPPTIPLPPAAGLRSALAADPYLRSLHHISTCSHESHAALRASLYICCHSYSAVHRQAGWLGCPGRNVHNGVNKSGA